MNYLGVDPGADGALAVIRPRGPITIFGFKDQSLQDIIDVFTAETLEPCVAYLEQVQGRPRQANGFQFGERVGEVKTILTMLKVPLHRVAPQTWQRGVKVGRSFANKTARKTAHHNLAQQLYPGVRILKPHADAVLIAEFARRYHI